MTQWEYTITQTPDYTTDGHLNVHGDAGWELVTIISRPGLAERAVFKRPIYTQTVETGPVPVKKRAR